MGRAQRKSQETHQSRRYARDGHQKILDERAVLEQLEADAGEKYGTDPLIGLRNGLVLGAGAWLVILAVLVTVL